MKPFTFHFIHFVVATCLISPYSSSSFVQIRCEKKNRRRTKAKTYQKFHFNTFFLFRRNTKIQTIHEKYLSKIRTEPIRVEVKESLTKTVSYFLIRSTIYITTRGTHTLLVCRVAKARTKRREEKEKHTKRDQKPLTRGARSRQQFLQSKPAQTAASTVATTKPF